MPQPPLKPPSNPLPAATAEYETAMPGGPGKLPHVQQWKMFRTGKGETHLDFGKTALISKPGTNQTILLDHVKKEAHILPAPTPPAAPQAPGQMAVGAGPHAPAPTSLLNVKDLGRQMVGGHDAEGKMYTFQSPKPPSVPAASGAPAAPGAPPPALGALPKIPAAPAAPAAPAPTAPAPQVHSLEVWTHAQLKVPVLTKAHGAPHSPTSVCKDAKGGEPPASLFQIPPGYKVMPTKV